MRVPDTPLHVLDVGPRDAPAVMLLHSIASHGGLWAPQIPIWSARLRLLVVDLPGHGSSAPDLRVTSVQEYAHRVAGLLDAYDIAQCAVVGLSLGGMIGQAFALDYPDRLRALVLANTSAQTPAPLRETWESRKSQVLREGMDSQVAATLARWFPSDFAGRAPLTLAWVADMIRRTSPEGYACAITAIQSLALAERLGAIVCPTLVIAGGLDVATTPEIMRALAGRIAGARFTTLAAAGHISNLVETTEFTEQVGEFLGFHLQLGAS